MGTERIDTKSLLAENRKTCDWVTSRGLTFSMSGDDAREILDALAQELSDAAVLRERIRLLEQAQTLLCDVVNQACQEDYDDKGPIISDLALSAYEDAIAWLEKMGLAIRIPGKLLRWRLTWPDSPAAASEEDR